MSDTPQLLLAHHLKALRLPTFLREYDKIAQQCAAEGVDHPRYLLRLAELELIERERRMVERRIKEARFPTVKSLDSFDFTFRRDAHPMAVMCGVVGALAAFYHDGLDIFDPHHRMIASHRLVAKMPTIAAMAYKYSLGQPFVYPRNDLGYAESFLNMLFSVPCEPYRAPAAAARALEALLIIQADHEQNASTSAMRLVGSTRANPYACTAAAIAALWGPLHGGANEAVLQTLAEIGSVERIPEVFLQELRPAGQGIAPALLRGARRARPA